MFAFTIRGQNTARVLVAETFRSPFDPHQVGNVRKEDDLVFQLELQAIVKWYITDKVLLPVDGFDFVVKLRADFNRDVLGIGVPTLQIQRKQLGCESRVGGERFQYDEAITGNARLEAHLIANDERPDGFVVDSLNWRPAVLIAGGDRLEAGKTTVNNGVLQLLWKFNILKHRLQAIATHFETILFALGDTPGTNHADNVILHFVIVFKNKIYTTFRQMMVTFQNNIAETHSGRQEMLQHTQA